MKTIKNNKLDFKTASIIELNDGNMASVNGGTGPTLIDTDAIDRWHRILSISIYQQTN